MVRRRRRRGDGGRKGWELMRTPELLLEMARQKTRMIFIHGSKANAVAIKLPC